MLVEQQLQSVSGCREQRRELAAATDGKGLVGVLAMQITDALGVIDSVSRSRIITTEQETLIAQLTVTGLYNSPVADNVSAQRSGGCVGGSRVRGAPRRRSGNGNARWSLMADSGAKGRWGQVLRYVFGVAVCVLAGINVLIGSAWYLCLVLLSSESASSTGASVVFFVLGSAGLGMRLSAVIFPGSREMCTSSTD